MIKKGNSSWSRIKFYANLYIYMLYWIGLLFAYGHKSLAPSLGKGIREKIGEDCLK